MNAGDILFGRYRLLGSLGEGGMGVVYRALDLSRDVEVALKTMPRPEADDIYRFKQEFRALADLAHRNLIQFFDLMGEGEQWFYTMEIVEGVPFTSFVGVSPQGGETATAPLGSNRAPRASEEPPLAHGGPIYDIGAILAETPRVRCDVALLRTALVQLVRGVQALHEAGKLHRDLKPTNVLVTLEGRVVVLDLGLVAELRRRPFDHDGDDLIAGTPAYMAPEQVDRAPPTPATDWYAVGVILFECLTGRPPFEGHPWDVIAAKRADDAPRPSRCVTGVPKELDDLCAALLARDPAVRPSGREILAVLAPASGESFAGSHLESALAPDDVAPWVGRERELAALQAAFVAGVRSGDASIAYVHGPSGMGKSGLLERFLSGLAARREALVLAGRCFEQESIPYKALDTVFDSLTGHLASWSEPELSRVLPENPHVLGRLFPVLHRIPAIRAPAEERAVPDEHEFRRLAFGAVRVLLARIAMRRPVVIAIDDLQWGDLDSATLLIELLRPPLPPPIFLLASYRSEESATSPCLRALLAEHPARATAQHVSAIELGPLDEHDAARLAERLAGSGAREIDARHIAREAGGSPFFVAELAWAARGDRAPAADSTRIGPPTFDNMLRARLEALPQSAIDLLEIFATAGRPIAEPLALAATHPGDSVSSSLALLRASRLVRISRSGTDRRIETYHDRIREAVIRDLDAGRSRERHRGLAKAMEIHTPDDSEAMARHWLAAGEADRAAVHAVRAGDTAAAALAFDRAAMFYEMALGSMPAGEFELRPIQVKLAEALANAGRGKAAAETFLRAAEGVRGHEADSLVRRSAYQYSVSGHIDDARVIFRDLLPRYGLQFPERRVQVFARLALWQVQLRLRGIRFRERAETKTTPAERLRCDLAYDCAATFTIADTLSAVALGTQSALAALRLGEPYRVARALAFEGSNHVMVSGKGVRRAERLLDVARRCAEKLQNAHALGLCSLTPALAAFSSGQWRIAGDLFDKAERLMSENCVGVAWELGTIRSFRSLNMFHRGELDTMVRLHEAIAADGLARGDALVLANLAVGSGPLSRLVLGDVSGARALLEGRPRWSAEGQLHDAVAVFTSVHIDFYEENWAQAWKRIATAWTGLTKLQIVNLRGMRIFGLHFHGQAAAAAAGAQRAPSSALRRAERDAKRLQGERLPWADGMALGLQAAIYAAGGEGRAAADAYRRADTAFRDLGMLGYAAAARRRFGEIVGGEEGAVWIADADRWFADQGVVDPSRMSSTMLPRAWASRLGPFETPKRSRREERERECALSFGE